MLDFCQICAILPQRHPMLLVDKVESINPGVSIVGLKAITATETCYQGVPDNSSLARYKYPQSLIVESFGQTAAILWLYSANSLNRNADRVLMFAVLRDFEVEGHAFPGDVLRHLVRLEKTLVDTVLVAGETWVGDRRIATVGSMVAVARARSEVLGHAPSPHVVLDHDSQTSDNLLAQMPVQPAG